MGAWPGVYSDEEGNVIGFWGLAQAEMPHRLEVEGRPLYTWCAWDSLFIPLILGKTARVESTCATTGKAVSLTVGPDRVEEASPPGAVLSFLRPDRQFDHDVILSFCHHVLFFASEEAGKQWTSQRADSFLLSIDEGFELGRLVVQGSFGAAVAASGKASSKSTPARTRCRDRR